MIVLTGWLKMDETERRSRSSLKATSKIASSFSEILSDLNYEFVNHIVPVHFIKPDIIKGKTFGRGLEVSLHCVNGQHFA